MRYTKRITKISLCCGILSSLIWQDTIELAVGHYTVSRDPDVTDQECRLSFPDHLPCPRQDGGRKWAGDETTSKQPCTTEAGSILLHSSSRLFRSGNLVFSSRNWDRDRDWGHWKTCSFLPFFSSNTLTRDK